ncbi:DNA repair protein recA like 3, mitochondrial [Glycine soja]|uniref:DNA repair protein recA like 3, mitochondrial n=1 Tax=Glycine soja TaxID=3848 RepID=A0A0B2PG71_GLYSO|nr:DNA repair protein recA like 3, mitochondrial [Glycine soja]
MTCRLIQFSFFIFSSSGHVVEIYGPEASVKTTLALHVIAEAQKQGGYCVFVDAEHALDKKLAESIGVNTTNLLLSQPDCGEQALSLVDTLIRSGSVDVIVVDSVAALVPKGELDGEMGHAHMAMQARLMSQALRKLSHALSPSQCILIFINQVRSNISTFGGFSGPTEILGSQVLVKVVKNKLVPPFKIAEFELQFGKGISKETEIIDLSVKNKLISKAGAMFYYNEQSFRGKDALKNFLAENQSALEELEMKLREKLLNAETEKMWDVINGDVREAIATVDSTDEEAAAIVEA